MTACAYINWGGTPVLLGDTLITGGRKAEGIETIFQRQIEEALSSHGYKFSHLMSKISDISPRLSICWSGSVIEASRFVRELKVATKSPKFDRDALSRFFSSYPQEDARNLQVIAVLMLKRTRHVVETLNTCAFEIEGVPVALIGSGTAELHKILSAWIEGGQMRQFHTEPWTLLVAALYHHVIVGGFGLKEAWGGGFETRAGFEGRLLRPNMIASSIFTVTPFSGEGRVFRLISEYAQLYSNDWAIFSCNGSPMAAVQIDHDFNEGLHKDLKIIFDPSHVSIGFAFGNKGLFVAFSIGDDIPRISGSPEQIGNAFRWTYTEQAMTRAYQLMRTEFPAWGAALDRNNAFNVSANRGAS